MCVQSTTTFESPLNVEATRCASCVDRRLRARLDSEREMCDALRLELAESKRGHQSQQQRDSRKLNDCSRYETAAHLWFHQWCFYMTQMSAFTGTCTCTFYYLSVNFDSGSILFMTCAVDPRISFFIVTVTPRLVTVLVHVL